MMRSGGLTRKIKCLMSPYDIIILINKCNLTFSTLAIKFLINQIIDLIGIDQLQFIINKVALDGKVLWQESFDVEKIVDKIKINDVDYFLVKWLGWSELCNTWEPVGNLNCPEKLTEFFENSYSSSTAEIDGSDWIETLIQHFLDNKSLLKDLAKQTKSEKYLASFYNDKDFIKQGFSEYIERKVKYHKSSLQRAERYFRKVSNAEGVIYIENVSDLEAIPRNFSFINESFLSPELGTFEPEDQYCCDCDDCSRSILKCPCVNYKGTNYPYTCDGLCFLKRSCLIFECGPKCKCYKNCPNKVVQNGRKMDLCLFRTPSGRGWGVKSMSKIKHGTFVCEYVGEIVTDQIAEYRGIVYDSGRMSYLFDMDFENNGNPLVVDAKYYGNISRFINHSCDPNLHVLSTWCGHRDPRIYRLSLFARRNIEADEELTFDYYIQNSGSSSRQSGWGVVLMFRD